MHKMPCDGDNESSQTVDRILSMGFHWAWEALLESIKKNGVPDPNLFSRSWIAENLGRSFRKSFFILSDHQLCRDLKSLFCSYKWGLKRHYTFTESPKVDE